MHKKLKVLSVITVILMVISLSVTLTPAKVVQAQAPAPAHIIYNIYATDGYWTMADGVKQYSYGFIGGRQGQPFSYINQLGALVTVPAGPPAPTGGPITVAETQFAGNAQFPAPLIYCRAGDVVEIRLKNLGVANKKAPNDPHSIHLHGIDVDAANDGVPETSVAAIPANSVLLGAGNVVVYMFTAANPGTYMYHCHQEASIHVTMGMYGALVVYDPADAAATLGPGSGSGTLFGYNYSRDYIMLLSDTDTGTHRAEGGQQPGYNIALYKPQYWFINGLSFPQTIHAGFVAANGWNNWIAAHPGYDPFIQGSTGSGEKILVRVINMGFETHPMHVHGFHPKVIGSDQRAWTWSNSQVTGEGYEKNTITIGSGETYELLFDMSQQQVASTYPNGTGGINGTFAGGTQSKYSAQGPVSNTNPAGLAIPDPLVAPPANYIGGPTVSGLVGVADTSQFFPFHNHDDYKATNNGVYPGGMFTMIKMLP